MARRASLIAPRDLGTLTGSDMDDLRVTGAITIPGREMTWTAVRSSGPGGQNVNKVASKVDLRFDFEASSALTRTVKARLRALARHRSDGEGRIQILSQATRDQSRNLDDARAKLASLVRQALVAPKARRATKPSRGARERRLKEKRHNAQRKEGRRRVNY